MPTWTAVELAPGLALFVAAEHGALRRAVFDRSLRKAPSGFRPEDRQDRSPVFIQAVRELREYMSGQRRVFTVPFELEGTHFQCRVWAELFKIPYGELRSYKDVARATGNERASRAVGAANARNPLPVIVPCHRVIAADGGLGGYAAGLEVKRLLLSIEGITC